MSELSNPAASQYQPITQITSSGSGGGKLTTTSVSTTPATHSSGTLPFTGSDAFTLVAVAVVMVIVGAAMKRLARV